MDTSVISGRIELFNGLNIFFEVGVFSDCLLDQGLEFSFHFPCTLIAELDFFLLIMKQGFRIPLRNMVSIS